jgi:hypothetical protein
LNGLDANRLIGDHPVTFKVNEILNAKDWPGVVALVSKTVFRSIEKEKSTKDLLIKINRILRLDVDQQKIDAAMPYFEIRHLLVHNEGKADETFCNNFPSFNAEPKKAIKLDFVMIQNATNAICQLIQEFDEKVIQNNVIGNDKIQR